MSARSLRTFLLSVRRVSPPVPGRTPSRGSSGRLTADERSSTRMISSQARASSYPPPAVVPLHAARNFSPEYRLASSMPIRVSLVNLQKFTFQACEERRSEERRVGKEGGTGGWMYAGTGGESGR